MAAKCKTKKMCVVAVGTLQPQLLDEINMSIKTVFIYVMALMMHKKI